MVIGGLQRFSLIDYPGRIACVIFTQGCNFRCPYCYNRSLVLPQFYEEPLPEEEVLSFLRSRKGLIEAVVVSGGEPTVQEDLPEFLRKLREMGFLLKLDTNGTHPETVKELIRTGAVDYVAMDVKAPLSRYREVVREEVNTQNIALSVALLLSSGVDYEFRTTLVRELISEEDILQIAEKLIRGAKRYALQRFVATDTLVDPSFKECTTYSEEELRRLLPRLEKFVEEVLIR